MDFDDDLTGFDDFEDESLDTNFDQESFSDNIDDNFINEHIQEISPVDEKIETDDINKIVVESTTIKDINLSKGIVVGDIDLSAFGIE